MAYPNFENGPKTGLHPLGVKFIFLVFFEELLHANMWLKLPKGCRAGC
jgi:hypothetical protein